MFFCDSSGWAISKNSKHKNSAKNLFNTCLLKSSEYFTETGLIVPARIEASNLIEEKIFIEAITTSVPTPVNQEYKKLTDKYKLH